MIGMWLRSDTVGRRAAVIAAAVGAWIVSVPAPSIAEDVNCILRGTEKMTLTVRDGDRRIWSGELQRNQYRSIPAAVGQPLTIEAKTPADGREVTTTIRPASCRRSIIPIPSTAGDQKQDNG